MFTETVVIDETTGESVTLEAPSAAELDDLVESVLSEES